MLRSSRLMVLFVAGAAAGLFLSEAPATAQVTSYEWWHYPDRLAQSRQRARDRYSHWYRDWNREYRLRHGPAVDAGWIAEPEVALALHDWPLPRERVAVRVVPPPVAVVTWDDRAYTDILRLSREIAGHLRDLQIALQRARLDRQVEPEFTRALQAIEGLTAAAARRDSPEQVQARVGQFDRNWQPAARLLDTEPDLRAPLRERIDAVNRLTATLHERVQVAPGTHFDRLRTGALAQQLTDWTARLHDEVEREVRRNEAVEPLRWQIERMHRHAANMAAAVRDGLDIHVVTSEYRQFADAWTRFVNRLERLPAFRGDVHEFTRAISFIDTQLQRELLSEPPAYDERQQTAALATRITSIAQRLAEDLRAEFRSDRHPTVAAADRFAYAAGLVQTAIHEGRETDRAMRRLAGAWRELSDRVGTLDRRRLRHARDVAAVLEEDLIRLEGLMGDTRL